jgi:hypothetical protein
MLHKNAWQFEWLLNAIYDPDDLFIVHVDLKSLFNFKGRGGTYRRVRELISGKSNIVLMRPRSTNWGGWSLSQIALDAIDLALDRDERWAYFVNLSGECYPLRPLADLRQVLSASPRSLYVETIPFSALPPGAWHLRRPRVVDTPVKIIPLPGRRQPPKDFVLDHKGSQWVMLSREFCAWQRGSPLRRAVAGYMRHSPLSDEMIFQTLMLNSGFRELQAPHHGRAIRLVEPNPHPSVLRLEDMGFLEESGAFFGRKFDASADAAVLRALADRIGAKPGPEPTG